MAEEPRSYAPTEDNRDRDAARPEGVDQYDFDGADNPQEDGGDPSYGAQQGVNHTRWADKIEAQRGQGAKTRARNKEIVNGRLT